MRGIPAWVKKLTVPAALVLIALAIVFLGFGHLLASPMGIVAVVVIGGGYAYWRYRNRESVEPEA